MAAVLTPPRPTAPAGRAHLRLVLPHETAEPSEPIEPLFSPQAVLVAVVLTLVLVFGALALGRGAFAGFAPDGPSPAAAAAVPADATAGSTAADGTVLVRPGDTMWSIARDLQPDGDIRPLVDRLVAAHGSSSIVPGDRISLDG